MTGYITKAEPDEDGDVVSLKIPNREISSIFEDTEVRFFNETVRGGVIKELIESLWKSEAGQATVILLQSQSISVN